MQNINFVLAHMYHLKYFIPLAIEANNRGIKSKFYTFFEKKEDLDNLKLSHNSPYKHLIEINELGREYGFDFELRNSKDNNISGLTFFGERRGLSHFLNNQKINKVVLTCLRDFVEKGYYDWYVTKVNAIIFISEFVAKYYNKISDINHYFGSPKYDVFLDKSSILKKYKMGFEKKILVLFPELYAFDRTALKSLYDVLHKKGYQILVKDRKKQLAPEDVRGDIYFDDNSWFPHPTMELIEVCDLVISFDSSVSKECMMASVPHLNIHLTEGYLPFKFLYDYECCKNIDSSSILKVGGVIDYLTTTDLAEQFKKCQKEKLSVHGNASKKILDYFCEKN